MSLLLLSLNEIKQSITMEQAINAMEHAFMQLANNQVKLPLRTGVSIEDKQALMLTMPAYLEKDKALGLKVISIFPNNLAQNKPSINGLILLLDANTGEAKAIMDAGYLTALRTGAVSGLATKYFSIENAEHVAIIGTGAQAHTQLEAIAAVRPIKRVSVWSRNIKNANAFVEKWKNRFDIKAYETVSLAIKDADIICTATSSTEPLIQLQDLQSHVHINAIGSHSKSMREIGNDVLNQSVVIVDQLEAALAESGEIISAMDQNQLKKESIIEIGHWLLNKEPHYHNQLTVFKSVGLAIQDLSVAEIVYNHALSNSLGLQFSLT